MDERVRFIGALTSARYTMAELCREFGISRKTGYKWADRYLEEGVDGLKDRSRAPKSCPHRTDPRCVDALIEERTRRPLWGPRKLLVVLKRRHPDWPWPAASTAGAILKRHGMVEPRRRRRRVPPPSKPDIVAVQPNAVWTADFKGEFRVGDGTMCFPLTAADRCSRFLLDCRGRSSVAGADAWPVFEALFSRYGLPDQMLTDGGPPFATSQAPRHLSRLAVWWIRLGITPRVTEPGHPEQNGAHERMHRTLKASTARPPAADMARQQDCFDSFRREYNEERPHESLEMQCPADLYTPSTRRYPSRLPDVEYPGHYEVRRIGRSGVLRFAGETPYLTKTLAGQRVGLEEVDDGLWSLYFGPLLLGRWDQRERDLDLL